MRWKQAAMFGAALAAGAAGCGGSQTLSRAEFVKRADAVCARTRADALAMLRGVIAEQQAGRLSEAQVLARARPKLIAFERHQLRELTALKAPSELQGTFAQWRGIMETQIREPPVRVADMTPAWHAKARARGQRRERLKRSLGFTQC